MEYFTLISLLTAMIMFLTLNLRQIRVPVKIKSEKSKRYICIGLLFATMLSYGAIPDAYAADIWVDTSIDENDHFFLLSRLNIHIFKDSNQIASYASFNFIILKRARNDS